MLIKKCVSAITNSIILPTPVSANTTMQVPIQHEISTSIECISPDNNVTVTTP